MSDMTTTIIPKSDQLNADQLLTGPITIKVTGVSVVAGEQPVTISYGGDAGRPYKPGKSMRRVLVKLWGADANAYVGRSMTLYTDPTIRFGGMEVGGIRISHMTHIDGPQTMALTETKGKKKPFTVRPLVIEEPRHEESRKPGFADWLPTYRDRLAAAKDTDALMALMASDDTAITIRNKGTDRQKAAMAEIEAAARKLIEGDEA